MASQSERTNTVVVGASAAGLAAAACLRRAGVETVLLEQAAQVGDAWRHHYDRLHLHTPRDSSALPFLPFPSGTPRYPSRSQVVEYLERYATEMRLAPRFGQRVTAVRRGPDGWVTETADGTLESRHVVIATGFTRCPHVPRWPGQDDYQGEILHSSTYDNGARFRDRPVLVIGFGNSAGEITIDLHEHGAHPTIAVRGRVNVIPRDLFGIPILTVSIWLSRLSARVTDALSAPLCRLALGDIEALGLRRLPYGPATQILQDGHVPVLDIGTIAHIRAGHIAVRPAVSRFTQHGVVFEDGREEGFAAAVLATGYRPKVAEILPDAGAAYDAEGTPMTSGNEAMPGLYFCGFRVSPTGMLREINKEAERIALAIGRNS